MSCDIQELYLSLCYFVLIVLQSTFTSYFDNKQAVSKRCDRVEVEHALYLTPTYSLITSRHSEMHQTLTACSHKEMRHFASGCNYQP